MYVCKCYNGDLLDAINKREKFKSQRKENWKGKKIPKNLSLKPTFTGLACCLKFLIVLLIYLNKVL